MPVFKVEALEKFVVRTTYFVKAATPQEAEQKCRTGKASYESKEIEEGDEEWLETISVEEDPNYDPNNAD